MIDHGRRDPTTPTRELRAGIDTTVVHVRDEARRVCRVGLVIGSNGVPSDGSFPELRIRVIRPSGLSAIGAEDDEGAYRHTVDRLTVGNPPGVEHSQRVLDSWHRIGSCGYSAADFGDAPAGAGHSVEAERG